MKREESRITRCCVAVVFSPPGPEDDDSDLRLQPTVTASITMRMEASLCRISASALLLSGRCSHVSYVSARRSDLCTEGKQGSRRLVLQSVCVSVCVCNNVRRTRNPAPLLSSSSVNHGGNRRGSLYLLVFELLLSQYPYIREF